MITFFGRQCWRLCMPAQSSGRSSLMHGSSTVPLAPAHGLMSKGLPTASHKRRAENKEIRCPLCSRSPLEEVQGQLRDEEAIFAFLDDTYVSSTPRRVHELYVAYRRALWAQARIELNSRKTRVWNSNGKSPTASCSASRLSKTYRQHGYCCTTVLLHGPTTFCVPCPQPRQQHTLPRMTQQVWRRPCATFTVVTPDRNTWSDEVAL